MDEKQKDDIHLKVAVNRYRFLSKKDVTIGMEQFERFVQEIASYDYPVAVFEEVLSRKKGELNALLTETIPGIMQTDFGGLSSMEYPDMSIKMEEVVSVKVIDQAKMFQMFEEYGREGLIKSTVKLPRGTDTSWIEEQAKERGIDVEIDSEINWNTRDKAIKDIMNQYPDQELEDMFPADAVIVSKFARAKIKEKASE